MGHESTRKHTESEAASIPGYDFTTWFGLVAPMGTPKPIIDRLNRTVIDVVRSPDVKQKMQAAGLDPQPTTPADYGTFMQAEIVKWRKVIEVAGIPKGSSAGVGEIDIMGEACDTRHI